MRLVFRLVEGTPFYRARDITFYRMFKFVIGGTLNNQRRVMWVASQHLHKSSHNRVRTEESLVILYYTVLAARLPSRKK